MTDSQNNDHSHKKGIDQFSYFDFIECDNESFLDIMDIDLEDEDYNQIPENGNNQMQINKPEVDENITMAENKNINLSLNKKQPNIRQKRLRKKINTSIQKEMEMQKLINISFQDFNQYLNIKINKEKKTKVTKETLIYMYNNFHNYLKMPVLSREDRRDKKKILNKLYKFSNKIIECFEADPKTFLDPVILFSGIKFFQRNKNFEKVDDLKKALNLA